MSNRSIVSTSASLPPGGLPPSDSDGRLRILSITNHALGWKSYAASLESTAARRDDVDAVHVHAVAGPVVSLVGAGAPGRLGTGRLDPHLRRTRAAAFTTARWLRRNVDLSRFDLIHVTPQFTASALVGTLGLPPVVLGIDATATQAKAQRNGIAEGEVAGRFGPLLRVEADVFDLADSIVCMSQWAADALPDDARSKAIVVPPSVALPPPSGAPLDDGIIDLLFVGNDWERKGGDRLLRWHQEHFADATRLHVCGAGAPIDSTARNVIWHGATPRDELLGRIAPQMHAFVLPTRSDMSPWAVVEAASAGLPVIASEIGAIGELVVDGVTGFLRSPDDEAGFVDALRRFVGDGAVRRRLAVAASARATRELDHRDLGDRLVAHWRTVASARTSSGSELDAD